MREDGSLRRPIKRMTYWRRLKIKPRRWRLWQCFLGPFNLSLALREITVLNMRGFRAKLWATRPEHLHSGHVHVCVLATLNEKLLLAGITPK